MGWNVVDALLFKFSIRRSVPEIFAIKVESWKKNCAEFWTLFAHPNFVGGTPWKISVQLITPAIRKVMPTTPKVLDANMLHFKPNFKCSPLEFFLGIPTQFVMCGKNLCWISIANRGRNIVSRKSWIGWVQLQTHMSYFMDSGPKFTRLVSQNAGGIVLDHVFAIFAILFRSGDIRDQSRKLCKIGPNLHVFGPQNF